MLDNNVTITTHTPAGLAYFLIVKNSSEQERGILLLDNNRKGIFPSFDTFFLFTQFSEV